MKINTLLTLAVVLFPAFLSEAAKRVDYSPFAGTYQGTYLRTFYPSLDDADQSVSSFDGTSVQVFKIDRKRRNATLDANSLLFDEPGTIRYNFGAQRVVTTNEYASFESDYGLIGFLFSGKAGASRRAIRANLLDSSLRVVLSLTLTQTKRRINLQTTHSFYSLGGALNVAETYNGSRAKRKSERRRN